MKPGDKFELGCGAELTVIALEPIVFRICNLDSDRVFVKTDQDWASDAAFVFKVEAIQMLLKVLSQFPGVEEVPHGRPV